MKSFYLLFVSSILLLLPAVGKTQIIKVRTQQQFDEAIKKINQGEEMHLQLACKTFFLNENVVANVPLSIESNKGVINSYTSAYMPSDAVGVEDGYYVYKHGASFTPFSLFYDDKGRIINVSESVDKDILVNLIDSEIIGGAYDAGSEIKIPISENLNHLKNKKFSNAFGYLDAGWGVVSFSLERSDNEFFYCTTLIACSTLDYSYDKTHYKKAIRYVIFNSEKQPGQIFYDDKYLYVPRSIKKLYHINNSDVFKPSIQISSDIFLKGITFIGGDGIRIRSNAIRQCEVTDCTFKNCLNTALEIERVETKGINQTIISDCEFIACSIYDGSIINVSTSYQGVNPVKMSGCTISRYPDNRVSYKNTVSELYINGNAEIINNTFYNTPRGHVGCRFGDIIIKGNVIYNTDSFNSETYRNLSSDFGLIYCNHMFKITQKALENNYHRIMIENNLLYGAYGYHNDARGIFIDDGRGDVVCKNNIILNTQVYSLDSRNTLQDAASIRNVFEGNIVTSNYRLEAGTAVRGENMPQTKANTLLTAQENDVLNILPVEKDVRTSIEPSCSCKDGKIFITSELYSILKKNPAWKDVGKFIKKRR